MELELIIFVGLQGSGKTTWYHEHFAATHVHVSKDLMPNARNRDTRQQEQIGEALAGGRSVVVDNTNPTLDSRAPLIALGHRHGARVVAVYFEAHVPTSLVRNRARQGKARGLAEIDVLEHERPPAGRPPQARPRAARRRCRG